MTPEDRDDIRARATIAIMAAMYANYIPNPAPRDETDAAKQARESRENIRRMERALEAANAADAVVAELAAREESQPGDGGAPQWPIHDGLPGGMPDSDVPVVRPGERAPLGANVLTCKHGRTSLEDCEECDAADAAEKAGKSGEEGQNGQIATGAPT